MKEYKLGDQNNFIKESSLKTHLKILGENCSFKKDLILNFMKDLKSNKYNIFYIYYSDKNFIYNEMTKKTELCMVHNKEDLYSSEIKTIDLNKFDNKENLLLIEEMLEIKDSFIFIDFNEKLLLNYSSEILNLLMRAIENNIKIILFSDYFDLNNYDYNIIMDNINNGIYFNSDFLIYKKYLMNRFSYKEDFINGIAKNEFIFNVDNKYKITF